MSEWKKRYQVRRVEGGPATEVFWLAGAVDRDSPRDWWREQGYGKEGDQPLPCRC
jgi:hypothetical protein